MSNEHALIWFRNDLRANWHSPLQHAIAQHEKVTALVFVTPEQWQHYCWSPVKINLYLDCIAQLRFDLQKRGVTLLVQQQGRFADMPGAVRRLCDALSVSHLYFNAEYELDERQRDRAVKAALANTQVGVFHDTCLVNPASLLNKQGQPYKVFTPYYNNWLAQLLAQLPALPSYAKGDVKSHVQAEQNSQASTHSVDALSYKVASKVADWSADPRLIAQTIEVFTQQRLNNYAEQRDLPAVDGTSQLSPYLACGAVAPAQLLHVLLAQVGEGGLHGKGGAATWLKELAWRDFYRYVMFHFPHVCRLQPFNAAYQGFPWRTDKQAFAAWCEGKTGFPIIDAAMRQLNSTGWMHNRLRMLAASFLCKHLLLPWRWGEDYFMRQLADGDFASNNGGWQWSASVGTDAAPYFRVFNPTIQSQRYDPNGEFLRQWVPELASLPGKHMHQPELYCDPVSLGYVKPIVDHKAAVARCKTTFKAVLDEYKNSLNQQA